MTSEIAEEVFDLLDRRKIQLGHDSDIEPGRRRVAIGITISRSGHL